MADGAGTRPTEAELESAASDGVDPNGHLDTSVSSRSNHDWDPDGVMPASGTTEWDPDGVIPASGTVATAGDLGTVATEDFVGHRAANLGFEIYFGKTQPPAVNTSVSNGEINFRPGQCEINSFGGACEVSISDNSEALPEAGTQYLRVIGIASDAGSGAGQSYVQGAGLQYEPGRESGAGGPLSGYDGSETPTVVSSNTMYDWRVVTDWNAGTTSWRAALEDGTVDTGSGPINTGNGYQTALAVADNSGRHVLYAAVGGRYI
jgi:hypothetical protein